MHAFILGLVQGITEFLPISSSGHLLLIPYVLGWPASGLAFDVALHAGTLLATVIYFFPKWWQLLTQGLIQRQPKELRLLGFLILATLPAAILGFFAGNAIENALRQPAIVALMLIIFALVLWAAERAAKLKQTMDQLTWKQSLFVGLAQTLALVPGVSRSGITITSGLVTGLTKEDATEFSFLLLAPITLGAVVTQGPKALQGADITPVIIGVITSFVAGLISIHFLLKFVKKYGFQPYIWYRLSVGIVFLVVVALRH